MTLSPTKRDFKVFNIYGLFYWEGKGRYSDYGSTGAGFTTPSEAVNDAIAYLQSVDDDSDLPELDFADLCS